MSCSRGEMQSRTEPGVRHLVLIGGGHSHALALRMLGMEPLRGVRLTLISDAAMAPYSGMLPGHIAGHYSHEECHIDLRRLCSFAGAAFIHGEVTGLSVEQRLVYVEGRAPVGFDVASLNTGSLPQMAGVPGAQEHAIPAKPVPLLLEAWARIREAAQQRVVRIAVAGGGAGGVELALSMNHALGSRAVVSIWHRGAQIMDTHNSRARRILTDTLRQRGVEIYTGAAMDRVEAGGFVSGGQEHPADFVIMALHAGPPAWLAQSGLALDAAGFVSVSGSLQSVSHPCIFAAGDVASMPHPRPKSGVFAVRMARPLTENIRRFFHGKPLNPYRPQRASLNLVGTADGSAVASRGTMALKAAWLWKWKDHIDRRFMARFSGLQPMKVPRPASGETDERTVPGALAILQRQALLRCQGCAAKIGSNVLTRTMARLQEEYPECLTQPPEALGIETGLAAADDAAVIRLPAGHRLVQTVDYMPALTADLWLFGRIATLHSFSDIFAMGAEPHSALAACLLPFGSDGLTGELLYQLLSGVLRELRDCGACLTGGHTAEGAVPGLALTCNGLLSAAALTKGGLAAGDILILTKPLGTGTLFAAEMRLQARAKWIDAAIHSMLQSNLPASRVLRAHQATACTDVTGFGLAGHLLEMLAPSGTGAVLQLEAIPVLAGALESTGAGILSSLHERNAIAVHSIANARDLASHRYLPLLFDPQTSGGLVAGIRPELAAACLAALHSAGCTASVIGRITHRSRDGALLLE